jgi:hypothetical protein
MAQAGEALMAGNTPRGIRKRLNATGAPRYQVRYLVRDPASPSGWIETSATFATLREAKAFKAERDNEAALGARRFDPTARPRPARPDLGTVQRLKEAGSFSENMERLQPTLATSHRTAVPPHPRR